jgi:hypothetical protein
MIKIIKRPNYDICPICKKRMEKFHHSFRKFEPGYYEVFFCYFCEPNEMHKEGITASIPAPLIMIADNYSELTENAPNEKAKKELEQSWDIFVRDDVYKKIPEGEPASITARIPIGRTDGHFDCAWIIAQSTPCGYTYSLRKKLLYEI